MILLDTEFHGKKSKCWISPGSPPVKLVTELDWDLQSDTWPLLCNSSMQIGSMNPEFHCELTKELCTWDPSKSDLEKRSSIGISQNFEKFSRPSLAMIYDSSGYGVPWEEVQMLNIPRLSTSETGYGVGLGLAKWHMTSIVQFFNANRIYESGVPLWID